MAKFKVLGVSVLAFVLDDGQALTIQPGIYELPENDSAVHRLVERKKLLPLDAPKEAPVSTEPSAPLDLPTEPPKEEPKAEEPAVVEEIPTTVTAPADGKSGKGGKPNKGGKKSAENNDAGEGWVETEVNTENKEETQP